MSETRYAVTSRVSSDGTDDAVHGAPGPVGAQGGQEGVIRYPPWGFEYRMPIEGQVLLAAPSGSNGNIAAIGARHPKYKPDYADDQWTATCFNEVTGTDIKLRSDGGIQIRSKGSTIELKTDGTGTWTSASGGTIEMKAGGVISFDGGSNNVNRDGDSIVVGTNFQAFLDAIATATSTPPFITGVLGTTSGGNPKVQA